MRWTLGGALAVAAVAVLLVTVVAMALPVTLLANAGITLPGEGDRRVRSLARQLDLIREAERELPLYPGSQRVREIHGTIAEGRGRALSVCWAAPVEFEVVRRSYLEYLGGRESGWAAVSGGTRLFRKGRVYLALSPCEGGTYQLAFSYQL
ncbi:MAG TPA: hypothetical protein VFN74_13595 [Chloroflexota bacterium]|nr:hypothetical protein [Chloroflexota bacterium]